MTLNRRQAAALLLSVWAVPAVAAPKARLNDRRWTRFGTATGPDHAAWTSILRGNVTQGRDGIARFAYARSDRGAIDAYVDELQGTDPTTLSAAAAMAYWINLYNAVTIQVVVSAYPVSSIRDIGGGLFRGGPWRQKLVRVAGVELSLDDIEHGILRPIWRDPRIHYAVNCASLGCPDLAPRAYVATRLATMLDDGARAYVNHPRGASVSDGRLIVSSIYEWFKSDFGGTDAGVIAHLSRYANPDLRAALQGITRIDGDRYDWRLNG